MEWGRIKGKGMEIVVEIVKGKGREAHLRGTLSASSLPDAASSALGQIRITC